MIFAKAGRKGAVEAEREEQAERERAEREDL